MLEVRRRQEQRVQDDAEQGKPPKPQTLREDHLTRMMAQSDRKHEQSAVSSQQSTVDSRQRQRGGRSLPTRTVDCQLLTVD